MRWLTIGLALLAMLALFDRAAASILSQPPALSRGSLAIVVGMLAAYALGGMCVALWPHAAVVLFLLAAVLGNRLDAMATAATLVRWDILGLILVMSSLITARITPHHHSPPRMVRGDHGHGTHGSQQPSSWRAAADNEGPNVP